MAEDSLQSRHNVARAEAALPTAVLGNLKGQSDAVVINCLRDPGVALLRELTDIPVIGLAETAMSVAGLLGRTFGVIVNEDRGIQVVQEQARMFNRTESFTRARAINIAVDELSAMPREEILFRLTEAVRSLVDTDQSEVIILGCTAFSPYLAELSESLAPSGHSGIPIIEPTALGIRMAEVLVDLGLAHSRRTYPQSTQYLEQELVGGATVTAPPPRL